MAAPHGCTQHCARTHTACRTPRFTATPTARIRARSPVGLTVAWRPGPNPNPGPVPSSVSALPPSLVWQKSNSSLTQQPRSTPAAPYHPTAVGPG
eukprot:scaffold136566_cov102-Phaeocystis_antarctica.AAC.2